MDYNDIHSRMERLYASIDERFDKDIEKHVKRFRTEEDTPTGNKLLKIGVSFNNKNNEAVARNKIFTIIDNLAKLKDHLKNKMASKGLEKNKIELEINSSIDLQLIMDISNQDKHGSPLTRTNRSGKNPQIQNVTSLLRVSGQSSVKINPFWTKSVQVEQGNADVKIDADITDGNGDKLCSLDQLIDNATLRWEEIIRKYNLTE